MGRLDGIVVRHRSKCRKLNGGARCTCRPSYRAWVWSPDDQTKLWQTFSSEAAARAWRQDAGGDVRRGSLRAPTPTTVRDAAEDLIDGIRSGRVRTKSGDPYKPSAIRGYEQALRLRVLPQLGGARLADVKRKDVQRIADEMLVEGASASGIRNAIMPLRVIFRRALEDGEVAVDPCARLRLPAVRSRRERAASPQEAAGLLAALPPDVRIVYACAFYGGLRAGELRALRWSDVDLAAGVIRVERAMDGSGVIVEPKSRYGRRKVPVVGVLRDLLLEHKAGTSSEGYALGPSPTRPFTLSNVHRRAKAAWANSPEELEAIGLHEARHTFASLLIAAGVNAKAISVFMGHASVETTFDLYGTSCPAARPRPPRSSTTTWNGQTRAAASPLLEGRRKKGSVTMQGAKPRALHYEGRTSEEQASTRGHARSRFPWRSDSSAAPSVDARSRPCPSSRTRFVPALSRFVEA